MRIPAAIRLKQSAAERAARRLLPRTVTLWKPSVDWRIAVLETLAFMAAALGLSWLLNPQDPFWTDGGFPWLWLAAAILALRYGSVIGVVAMALALAGWFLLQAYAGLAGEFPRASFLGGLILALIAGEFSDVWNSRLAQAQAVTAYIDERLHALTHNHFLLSVSHERLEQELIARPYTLRDLLAAMRGAVLRAPAAEALPAADWLLRLLAQTCRLECAALFAIDDTHLQPQAVASIGGFGALDESDPMLAAALESGQLTHVQSEPFVEGDRPSRYVVCAPAVTSNGRLLGVLVVEAMPFTALTLETLQLVSVLLAYYADSVDCADATQPVLAAYPRCPEDFALELVRMQRLLASAAVGSSLVAFSMRADAPDADEWLARIDRMRRSLDVAWMHREGDTRRLLVLLPLTAQSALAGYLERVGRVLREQYGADLAAAGIQVHTAAIGEAPAARQIASLLERSRA